MQRRRMSGLRFAALCSPVLLLCGCAGFGVTGLLNENFLTELGMGSTVASLPGNAPTLLVIVENATDRVVATQVSYRTEEQGVQAFTTTLNPATQRAEALICPIEELTMGEVSDTTAPGALVRLGNGAAGDPYIEVEPFGVVLQEGINFDCGDSITFSVRPSSASLSGYQIFAYIRRAGGEER